MNIAQVVKRLGEHFRRQQREKIVDFIGLVELIAGGGVPTDEFEVLAILEGAGKSFEQLAEAVAREEQRRKDLVIVARSEAVSAEMADCQRGRDAIRAEMIAFNNRMIERGQVIEERNKLLHSEQAAILQANERLRSSDLNEIQRADRDALSPEWMGLLAQERRLEDLLSLTGGLMGSHSRKPGRRLTDAKEALRQEEKKAKPSPPKIAELKAEVAAWQKRVDALAAELETVRGTKRIELERREQAIVLGTDTGASADVAAVSKKRSR